jgi:hypothetical protein
VTRPGLSRIPITRRQRHLSITVAPDPFPLESDHVDAGCADRSGPVQPFSIDRSKPRL